MTPQDCFGVVVRGFGLGLLLFSLYEFLLGLFFALVLQGSLPFSPVASYLGLGAVSFLVSLQLLRGAPYLVRFCYRDSSPPHR